MYFKVNFLRLSLQTNPSAFNNNSKIYSKSGLINPWAQNALYEVLSYSLAWLGYLSMNGDEKDPKIPNEIFYWMEF